MEHIIKQVKQFMTKAGQEMPDKPCLPDPKTAAFRVDFILEETSELIDALCDAYGMDKMVKHVITKYLDGARKMLSWFSDDTGEPNPAKLPDIADALADLAYIVPGAAIAFGLPFAKIFDAVHDANMKRFGQGSYIREDGKLVRSPDWTHPNIAEIIGKVKKQPPDLTAREFNRSK